MSYFLTKFLFSLFEEYLYLAYIKLMNPRIESCLTIFLAVFILQYTDFSSSVKEEEYPLNILRLSMVVETFNLKYLPVFLISTYPFWVIIFLKVMLKNFLTILNYKPSA